MKTLYKFLFVFFLLALQAASAVEVTVYYHNDALGSPAVATNDRGAKLWSEQYYPYGDRSENTPNSVALNTLWYTGKDYDPDTNLLYLNGRYYDPVIGRFMSVDPADVVGTNVHSFNRYAYANNNPYRFVDPGGNSPIDIAFLVYDVGKFIHALWTGSGAAEAAVDVGLSTAGVFSPVPGTGEAMKAARAAEHAAEALRAAEVGHTAGSVRNVNTVGGTMNCVNCAIATDATLAGRPASALAGGPYRIDALEKMYGAKFGLPGSISDISETMAVAGAGARGIVFGSRGDQVGHVFNVVNQNGIVRFLDGQTGGAASLNGFQSFQLLRTN